VIRIAAVADVHVGADSVGKLRPQFEHIGERADVLLIGGDLTRLGTRDEAAIFADEVAGLPVPIVAVLGNHDYHFDDVPGLLSELERVGVRVLEGNTATITVDGARLGIAGTKGFGGGFANASGSDFGEPEMKMFMRHTHALADQLEASLASLDTDVRVALLHYAPVPDTLQGERLEIYPFLGSYLLGRAIDTAGADLALHGHAHAGTEKGITPGGVHVRNVALPVIRHAYRVYCVPTPGEVLDDTAACEVVAGAAASGAT
jgi:Icc-related predicted phosphoesterase